MIRKLLQKYYLWEMERALSKAIKRTIALFVLTAEFAVKINQTEQDKVLEKAKKILEGETK